MKKISLSISILAILILTFQSCQNENKKEDLLDNTVSENDDLSHYQNPVFDHNFADPTVIKAIDGFYYAYGTNSSIDGKEIHIQVLRSKDLVHWEHKGDAMPTIPNWANADFWAPHVLYDAALKAYFLYYSGESNDANIGKCLGVATSKSPLGPFVDKGSPLLCGEGFVNIDPFAIDDLENNTKLLFWGSGFQSIKVQELADDRLSFKTNSKPKDLIQPLTNGNPENYENLIEGTWITKHDQYYYLYYSGDNCCGDKAHYAVMVARSENLMGPYKSYATSNGKSTSVILEKNNSWIAPGHNSIVTDSENQDWIIYHAIDAKNRDKGRVLLIDKINYVDGWPKIGNNTPSIGKENAPKTTNQ